MIYGTKYIIYRVKSMVYRNEYMKRETRNPTNARVVGGICRPVPGGREALRFQGVLGVVVALVHDLWVGKIELQ